MPILSKYIYKEYLRNVKLNSTKYKNEELTDYLMQWIFYKSMSEALGNLLKYISKFRSDNDLDLFIYRHEKETLRDSNIHPQFIIHEKCYMHVIYYNAEILYEIDLLEKQLNKKEIVNILTNYLNIKLTAHQIMKELI